MGTEWSHLISISIQPQSTIIVLHGGVVKLHGYKLSFMTPHHTNHYQECQYGLFDYPSQSV